MPGKSMLLACLLLSLSGCAAYAPYPMDHRGVQVQRYPLYATPLVIHGHERQRYYRYYPVLPRYDVAPAPGARYFHPDRRVERRYDGRYDRSPRYYRSAPRSAWEGQRHPYQGYPGPRGATPHGQQRESPRGWELRR